MVLSLVMADLNLFTRLDATDSAVVVITKHIWFSPFLSPFNLRLALRHGERTVPAIAFHTQRDLTQCAPSLENGFLKCSNTHHLHLLAFKLAMEYHH